MMQTRTETDSFGPIEVPAQHYWGAQTQRSLQFFAIGTEILPRPLIRSLAIVKRCAAQTNAELGLLKPELAAPLLQVADEIINGDWDAEFPLSIWQTGSGTQSNMNLNEVLANRANQLLGQPLGSRFPLHPNDHCNLSQSSNDVMPSAMNIAAAEQVHQLLLPALQALFLALNAKARLWWDQIKMGRTHLQDATPVTLGQEFSGYARQMELGIERVSQVLTRVYPLAQGATAVGTGLNCPAGFAEAFAQNVAQLTGLPFVSASNKFEALACHDGLVELSGVLNTLAVSLNKIANDLRLLGSGPRSGLAELILPANEPGSSIMPGKVNPTQCEALSMVCAQVMGNHLTISIAGAQGHLELNAFKPVIAYNLLQSIRLLADAIDSFNRHCIAGLQPNAPRLQQLLQASLMLVTALVPHIGYDRAASIAKQAEQQGLSLREAALAAGIAESDYDAWLQPAQMLAPFELKS